MFGIRHNIIHFKTLEAMKSFAQNTIVLRNVATMFILITFFGNWSKSNDTKKKDKKEEKKTEAIIKVGSDKRG